MAQAESSNEERALAVVNDSLANYKDEFVRLLGGSVDPEMFMSVAYEAFRTNRDLLQIALTAPDSLMKALHDAAALKLVPNGVLGSAYIVPRRNKQTGRSEAYFQVGYRGLEDLIMRSGHVSNIQSRVVYANENFRISYGTAPSIEHEPILDGDKRGKVRGFYGVARMRDGTFVIDYMTVDQVNAIRDRSPSKSGPWSTDYEEMGRKTIIRRLAKSLPMSVEVQAAIGADDAGEQGEVVATVTAPTKEASSLAGRIRQQIGSSEPEPKAEPKNVTPESTDDSGTNTDPAPDEPSESGSPADDSAMTPEPDTIEDASGAAEPPAKAAPKRRARKQSTEPEEPQEAAPDASDDLPDDEGEFVEPEQQGAKKYGALTGASQTWAGVVFAKGKGVVLRYATPDGNAWNGKLITENPDVQTYFDSLDDRAWIATIAGELKLVPWERDGQAMPPYRQITVKGIEVGVEAEVPS
jgi:recombination protein RecT